MTLHQIGNLPAKPEHLAYIRIFAQQAGVNLTLDECTKLITESQEGEKVKDLIGKLTFTL